MTRFVYIDESGTSAVEPATLVVGIIVNCDEQIALAESAIDEVLGAVPSQFRQGFVFHATELWGKEKYREGWGMADRLNLLKQMMAIPKKLGMPIAFGLVRREWEFSPPHGLSLAQYHHLYAFMACVAMSDKLIREKAGAREIGLLVAEDVPEMRKLLKLIPRKLRETPLFHPPEAMEPTPAEVRQGYMTQSGEMRVTRIRNAVHFMGKGDDPILQLADACAFGLRRFFLGKQFGDHFGEAIFGQPPNKDDYSALVAAAVFY